MNFSDSASLNMRIILMRSSGVQNRAYSAAALKNPNIDTAILTMRAIGSLALSSSSSSGSSRSELSACAASAQLVMYLSTLD